MDYIPEQARQCQLAAVRSGRAAVYLSDKTTWSDLDGATVVIYSDEEEWDDADGPRGYARYDLQDLITHYLKLTRLEVSP